MNGTGPLLAYAWRMWKYGARKSPVLPAPPAMVAPVVNSADTDTATEETPYTYASTVSAGNNLPNCPIVWTLETAPAWLTIDPTTGVVTGTPPDASAGDVPFTVRATNCAGTNALIVTLTISA